MKQIFASFYKEWLLLWRDKVGLIFLFILPMCLVLFITLTQTENPDKPRLIRVLLVNQDNNSLMINVAKEIKKIDGFKVSEIASSNANLYDLQQKVAKGKYQIMIVIPKSATQDFMKHMKAVRLGVDTGSKDVKSMPIVLTVDPTLPKSIQDGVKLSIQYLLQSVEKNMLQQTVQQMGRVNSNVKSDDALMVKIQPAALKGKVSAPNSVQQNVPAWALFGMFFIITPLSGVLVKERTLGVMNRLFIAPSSFAWLILGKILAFVLLNMVQLALMLAVGVFILPLFGLPALNVVDHLWQIIVIGLCASLAATGFGMLVGSFVRTAEQANVIGPFVIVIAAAIGGIFVPTYLLPDSMQRMSQFSPMHWAHAAFLDVFVRDAGLRELWPNLLKLLILFVVTSWLALMKITYRRN